MTQIPEDYRSFNAAKNYAHSISLRTWKFDAEIKTRAKQQAVSDADEKQKKISSIIDDL